MAAERPATWDEGMRIKEELLDYFERTAFVKLAPSLIQPPQPTLFRQHRRREKVSVSSGPITVFFNQLFQ